MGSDICVVDKLVGYRVVIANSPLSTVDFCLKS